MRVLYNSGKISKRVLKTLHSVDTADYLARAVSYSCKIFIKWATGQIVKQMFFVVFSCISISLLRHMLFQTKKYIFF
jgi:hypothetical protein